MTPLLHHVDLITNSRNRGAVEAAVVTAINEILGATRTELHKVFMPPGEVLVGLAAEIGAGDAVGARTYGEDFSWPEQIGSIEQSPHFQMCLGGDVPPPPSQERLPDGTVRIIVPIDNALHEPDAFLLILRPAALTAFEIEIVQGFVRLLKNCMALLDYGETDALTGLRNRKAFDACLARILASLPVTDDAAAAALPYPLPQSGAQPAARHHWLGVMDIDCFKPINERWGRQVGDAVLVQAAQLMRESFRIQDKLFRFGGAEFVALLRPAEYSHVMATFERFRARVAAFDFPRVGRITVSIGFTSIRRGDTPSAIRDKADAALTWARDHGRNQCRIGVHCS
ncbi:MAG: GGDEF domain-containing protein [Rhodocyclaceae bacterium]|nr:GGDEF domain-containing protein [Rhodocyclaceae bacterium]